MVRLLHAWTARSALFLALGLPCAAAPAPFQEPGATAQAADAQDPAGIEARGWVHYEAGRLDNAMSLFQRAVGLGRWQAWRGVAEIHRKNGDQERAREAFATLVEAGPEDLDARLEYGLLCSWTGQHAEAEEQLRLVEEQAQEQDLRERARRARVDNAAWSGDHRSAWRAYRHELDERPDDAEAHLGLAELELWRGRAGHARLHFRSALDRQPSSERARRGLTEAERLLAPEFLFQVQYLRDNAGWERFKTLTGAEFSPNPERYPGWRMFLGTEYAAFRDDSGADLERDSILSRQILQPDPFTRVHLDFDFGDHRDQTTVRGGVEANRELAPDTFAWAGWRHDDFINAFAPLPFDRYNQALAVDLARGDVVQADTFQVGGAWDPARGLGAVANLLAGSIDDGNSRSELYLQGHHRTEAGTQSMTWRGFFHWMDFADASPLYYSPSNRSGLGGGWRWERREDNWRVFADLSAYWESASSNGLGWQADLGWSTEWRPGASTGVELNYLTSDEGRLGGDRYSALAVLVHLTYDF